MSPRRLAAAAALGAVTASAAAPILLNLSDVGVRYWGVGALSAGASTRLLADYPPDIVEDVYDALFKPGAGGAMQIIKVEIGGEAQSTDGTEPAHMRTRDDLNCTRGYEWPMLAAAKKRNPSIVTYALSWGAPGWVGNGTYYSDDGLAFHVSWLQCAKQAWGVDVDYMGVWNEVAGGPALQAAWTKQLRAAMDDAGFTATRIVAADTGQWDPIVDELLADPALAAAVDVVGAHYPTQPPPNSSVLTAMGKLQITSEAWNLNVYSDWIGATALGSDLSRFARYGLSGAVIWAVLFGWYPNLPFAGPTKTSAGGAGHGLLTAAEPWSGHWEASAPLAAAAHWTQFTSLHGWSFLSATGSGIGMLPSGEGSYATLVDATGGQLSVVIETGAAKTPQNVTFALAPRPGGAPLPPALHVWRSTESALMARQPDVAVDASSGAFTLTLAPSAIYTVTTTTGQGWVAPSVPVPPSAPFPFPYYEAFDEAPGYAPGAAPRYFSDQGGIFTVEPIPVRLARPAEGAAAGGAAMAQSQPSSPIAWVWATNPYPYTVAGNGYPSSYPGSWVNYTVSVLAALDPADVPPIIPDTMYAAPVPCAGGGAATAWVPVPVTGGGGGGPGFWPGAGGGDGATLAQLTSAAYPHLCLGPVAADRNATTGGYHLALVPCAGPVAHEAKPVPWALNGSSGALQWPSVSTWVSSGGLGICAAEMGPGANGQRHVGGFPCGTVRAPAGAWAWAPNATAADGSGSLLLSGNASTCLGLTPGLAPGAFFFASLRVGATGMRHTWPSGITVVVYQARAPGQLGTWELLANDTSLASGMTPKTVTPGGWAQLTLTAAGATLSAWLDGLPLFTAHPLPPTPPRVSDAGMAAVGSSWHRVWFDNITLTPQAPPPTLGGLGAAAAD